jgi:hypothetical protein
MSLGFVGPYAEQEGTGGGSALYRWSVCWSNASVDIPSVLGASL